MTRICFTSFLGERIGDIHSVEVDAANVHSALRNLTDRYPVLGRILWLADGQFNPAMAVFLQDRQLQADELETPVGPGDRIDIIPAISGG